MQTASPWIDRSFSFGLAWDLYPNIVERVRGGPARVEEAVKSLPASKLIERPKSSWSIQEHVGHLLDIEALMSGRLDDFEQKRPQLRPWEESNDATWKANHNAVAMEGLLAFFRGARSGLVERFDSLDDSLVTQLSFHPRLKRPMRVIDLAYFIAEHDDHHLTQISFLKRRSALSLHAASTA